MAGNTKEENLSDHDPDRVYSGDVMGDMMVSMLSEVKENDLETFKKYIEDDTNGFKDIVSDIKYTSDVCI